MLRDVPNGLLGGHRAVVVARRQGKLAGLAVLVHPGQHGVRAEVVLEQHPAGVAAEVEFVDPKVTVLTAAPVAKLTVVADASVEIPRDPVPEFTVKVPFVEVTAKAPLPDWRVVAEVELADPKVAVFAPAPVATLTVVVVASVEIPIVPVPVFRVKAAFVGVMITPPLPD